MKHRLVALTAVVAVAFTGGCGAIGAAAAGGISDLGSSVATPAPTPSSSSGAWAIPDPCTLFSEAEVTGLTGREVTQIDEDGGADGDVTRYCQWQQSGGQLAVFLTRTTAEDFDVTVAEAEWVEGVGQDAYWHSGHLFVLHGTVQIDVYSRGASDDRNRADATKVAEALLPRI